MANFKIVKSNGEVEYVDGDTLDEQEGYLLVEDRGEVVYSILQAHCDEVFLVKPEEK
jgi:hypothetical protein